MCSDLINNRPALSYMGKTVHNLHMALEPMMVQFSHACRRRSTLGLLTLRMSCTVYIYQKLIDYDYHRRHSMKCACSSFFVVFFVIWYKTCIPIFRDDVIPWKRFLRCWPFVRESTGHRWIPSQLEWPVTRVMKFSLMLGWTNGWINCRVVGETLIVTSF